MRRALSYMWVDDYKARIRALVAKSGKSERQVIRESKVSHTVFDKCSFTGPSALTLISLSKYFHVSTDYILGLTEEEEPNDSNRNH